jgi:hypothetical protein
MRDKAANAAKTAAPITRALVALCISTGAPGAFAQLSDPMAPPGAVPAAGAASSGLAPELQAIISGPGRHLALINGNVVHVGESIPGDGALLSLGTDSATIRSGDQHLELRLHPDLRTKKQAPR